MTASIIAFQDGTGIAAQGGAVPLITCTDLFGNSGGDWVGDIADQGEIQENLSADPHIIEFESGRVRFAEDSPVLKLGIKPIDVSGAGIRPR